MNFKEFEELANSGAKEIALTEDVILEDGEEEKYKNGIKIIDDLIIDGNNHVFDAKGKTCIFLLNSQCIKIINCVFKGYDERLLKNVALNDSSEDVAVCAVERITSKSTLEEISQSERGIVSGVARRKMDKL